LDKKLLLAGADGGFVNSYKGYDHLASALKQMASGGWADKCELIIFGASQPSPKFDPGLKTHYVGFLHDPPTLALYYSAADVYVHPSTIDNLPNTVMEAMACGTPCVAFDIGGISDMIEHGTNGYLARPFEIEDFVAGITMLLEHDERRDAVSAMARQKVLKEFTADLAARRYASLYKEILTAPGRSRIFTASS
jgi:glycosyltransferase involved in cell wall biosynthesis